MPGVKNLSNIPPRALVLVYSSAGPSCTVCCSLCSQAVRMSIPDTVWKCFLQWSFRPSFDSVSAQVYRWVALRQDCNPTDFIRRIDIEHPDSDTRVELVDNEDAYNPGVTLMIDGQAQWNLSSGTTTQEYWFDKAGEADLVQQRFDVGAGVLETDFLHKLGSAMRPGSYDVVNMLVMPRHVPTRSASVDVPNDELSALKAMRAYDHYYEKEFSNHEHDRCHLTERFGDNVDCHPVFRTEHKDPCSRHFLMHAVLPLQPCGSLDANRVAHFERLLRNGVPCTAWAIGHLSADNYNSFEGNPWIRTALTSFLLDGHHKFHAAARASVPVSLLLFIPRFQFNAAGQSSLVCLQDAMPELFKSFASFSPMASSAPLSPLSDCIINEATDENTDEFRRWSRSATIRDVLERVVENHQCVFHCRGANEYLEGTLWPEWPPSRERLNTTLDELQIDDGWRFDHRLMWHGCSSAVEALSVTWKVAECVEEEAKLRRMLQCQLMHKKTKSNSAKAASIRHKLQMLRETVPYLMHNQLQAERHRCFIWNEADDEPEQENVEQVEMAATDAYDALDAAMQKVCGLRAVLYGQ